MQFHMNQTPWTPETRKRSHRSKIYGIGINDAPYNTAGCLYYDKWRTMLRRCYAEEYHVRHPYYIGCTVDPRWHYFMEFRQWLVQEGFVRGLHLDKDLIIPGNKVYSPETCILVPREINVFTTMNKSTTTLPPGVILNPRKNGKKYIAQIKIFGKQTFLGYYNTVEEAFNAYLKRKSQQAEVLSETVESPKVKKALINFSKRVVEYIK